MKQSRQPVKGKASKQVSVSEFKTHCLRIIERARTEGREYVITKRGEAVARLLPVGSLFQSPRGKWKKLLNIRGDIVEVDWSEEFEVTRK